MSRLIIKAEAAGRHYRAGLWWYRDLFFFLSWCNILVHYRQTIIGILRTINLFKVSFR